LTPLYGLTSGSNWTRLVRRPPASSILGYLVKQWAAYSNEFSGKGTPLSTRTEPELTEALAAFLTREQEAGLQPFDGEFYGELTRFELAPNGTRIRTGRTDIEWRLFGFPNFVVEFKMVSAGRKAIKYVTEGMVRFVDGRYGPRAPEGAMWAFIVAGSPENETDVRAHVEANAAFLRCTPTGGANVMAPSLIAPTVAAFDSIHDRSPAFDVIGLAHLFVDLPP
jgi:hypothetical protein